MSLTQYTNRLVPESHSLLERILGPSAPTSVVRGIGWIPAASIQEFDNELVLALELPGVAEDSIEIALENNVLTIFGEKGAEKGTEKGAERETDSEGKYLVLERSFGTFRRTFRLPGTVRADAITAELQNGLLTVRLPKAEEARTRKIEVRQRA